MATTNTKTSTTAKTNTVKKTSTPKATTKATTQKVVVGESVDKTVIEETPVVVKEVKTEKIFKPEDTITCRSVTKGELILPAKKSGITYDWADFGDYAEVEYQDLLALKVSKSAYIYSPLFIIEDDDLLDNSKWADIKKIYEDSYREDIDDILDMSYSSFETTMRNLPIGLLNALKVEVATRIEDGTFDSLQKIKLIDSVCGTDLMCLIN